MKKHSLVKEDQHSFLIHDGESAFHVAKSMIDPVMQKKIRGMPAYSDGGDVEADQPAPRKFDAIQKPLGSAADKYEEAMRQFPIPDGQKDAEAKGGWDAFKSDVGDAASELGLNDDGSPQQSGIDFASRYNTPSNSPAPTPDAANAPAAPMPQSDSSGGSPDRAPASDQMPSQDAGVMQRMKAAQAQELGAIGNKAAIEGQQADETQKALGSFYSPEKMKAMDQQVQDFENQKKQIQQDNAALMQKMQDKPLDPNGVWHSMGTGSKILAAFSIVLGGVGSQGDPAKNAAMNVLQDATDKDLKAQMADKSNNMNLYKMNLERYGDAQSAEIATKLQMNSAMQGQLAGISAKYGGQIAQQNAAALQGQFKQKFELDNRTLEQQLWLRQQATQLLNDSSGGSGGAQDPAKRVLAMGMLGLMNEKDQGEATKELGSAKEIEKLRANLNDASNQLKSKFLAGSLTPADRASHLNTYGGVLAKLGEGRFNMDESKQQIAAFMPAPGDAANTLHDKDMNRNNFLSTLKSTPTLDKYNIRVGPQASIKTFAPVAPKK
jgi:hypothetical protein